MPTEHCGVRALVLFALMPFGGCAAGAAVVAAVAAYSLVDELGDMSRLNEAQRAAAREEIEAMRLNAGLSFEQYRAELQVYDPEHYRDVRRKELLAEFQEQQRAAGRRRHDDRPIIDQMPPDLRRRYTGFPKTKTLWPVEFQLYRARRLAGGATEAQVLDELARKAPHWRKMLAEKWQAPR